MSIPFTQFMLPDGRQKRVVIDRPPPIEESAQRLIEDGCRFEIEMLSTGEIHMEVMHGEDSVAGKLCRNGPEVLDAVDEMIGEALSLRTLNPIAHGAQRKDSRKCD